MAALLGILGIVLYLAAVVCWIIIVIDAFKKGGALHGILSFCIWPYAIYWGFVKFEHPKKNLIVGGAIGGLVLAVVLQVMAGFMAASQ